MPPLSAPKVVPASVSRFEASIAGVASHISVFHFGPRASGGLVRCGAESIPRKYSDSSFSVSEPAIFPELAPRRSFANFALSPSPIRALRRGLSDSDARAIRRPSSRDCEARPGGPPSHATIRTRDARAPGAELSVYLPLLPRLRPSLKPCRATGYPGMCDRQPGTRVFSCR